MLGSTGAVRALEPSDSLLRIDALLQRGFVWLRFPADLERRFQRDSAPDRIRHHTIFALLGLLIFDSFLIGDSLLVPDMLELSMFLRLGVVTPLTLAAVWAIRRYESALLRELLMSIMFLMAGGTLLVIMLSTRSPYVQHYYIGLPVILLFGNTVQRMRFWFSATATALLFAAMWGALSHVSAIPQQVQQTFLSILAATGGMTLAALYSLEREERRAYLRRIREQSLAREDLLTQLPNRLALEEFLQARLAQPQPDQTSDYLLYLDLDHFKTINDTCGHAVGDRLLREIALVVRAQLQRSDFMARLGGDEFAVLLLETSEPAAHAMGERIIKAVQEYRLAHDQTTFAVAVSIGLVELDHRQSRQMSDVMAFADVACYAAKHAGRGRLYQYRHDDADIALAHRTIDWGQRLRRALDQNRFRLFLQQIVSADGHIEGHEALVRLCDDDGSILPPVAFLPAAKRLGLMTAIDRWVTHEVFSLLADGPELPGYVSVNLVPSSLSDKQFTGWLLATLRGRPELAGKVRFEITEVEKLQVASNEMSLLESLREMGFDIYLDDFGSGYASFELLKRIPVNGIKLDGNVVQDYMSDPVDQALVQAAVNLAQRLKIKLVAEGVETIAVLDALSALGVCKFQGYLFHKPQAWQAASEHAAEKIAAETAAIDHQP